MFSDLAITRMQALVFGLLTFPITVWIVWTDLFEMKIKNEAVLAMLAIFVFAGFFLMPFGDYAWRYLHFVVMLLICFALSATIGMGAGDAKYIAAVAPFIALDDTGSIALLYAIWSVLLLVGMFIARRSGRLRRAKPDWIWFSDDRKGYVPFGLALAPTVSSYFLFGYLAGGPRVQESLSLLP
ncbi:A24 family peptidase [Jannaschia faecimaris]|uniref:A24 family peptidase n=1 Tax=Jannaschia faecimaris TaxID=1244108 RepID=UPI0014805BF7|nr:prepilin peptidase [Jannaschia faecimaris]